MMKTAPATSEKHPFDLGAKLTLGFGLALILLSAAQFAYRYTLPTDGWAVTANGVAGPDWEYLNNLVGAPSPLQEHDILVAVGGQSLAGTASLSNNPPPANWVAGRSVQMTVKRDGQPLSFQVPVVHWTPGSWWRYNFQFPSQFVSLLSGLILVGVGFFTFFKRPEVPSARALFILCATFFAIGISSMLPDGLSVQFNRLAFVATGFFSYMIFGVLLTPSLLAFALLFPQPKRLIQRHSWLAPAPYGLGLTLAIAILVTKMAEIGWVAAMLTIIAAIASLVHSGFTQRDAVSRAQLRWVIGGFVVGLGFLLLTYPAAFGWLEDPFLAELLGAGGVPMGFTVVGVSMAIAITRYRLYDIDVIIRKTLIYAVVSAMSILAYFGSVVVLQSLFSARTGESSPIAIVVSTLLIAALFNPLRHRVQEAIDRRFYRRKYNAAQALDSFAATARDEVDLERLTAALVALIDETMQPEHVSLWLKPARQKSPIEREARN